MGMFESMFAYVLSLAHTYIRIFAHTMGMHLYIFTDISAVCCEEGLRQRKRVWEEKREREGGSEEWVGVKDCYNQNDFFFSWYNLNFW